MSSHLLPDHEVPEVVRVGPGWSVRRPGLESPPVEMAYLPKEKGWTQDMVDVVERLLAAL